MSQSMNLSSSSVSLEAATDLVPAIGDDLAVDAAASNGSESDEAIGVPDGFEVRDDASAAFIVRKVIEARAHADRVRAWAAAELRRAEREEAWMLRRFGPALEGWLRGELERRGGRRRSVALPAGTLGLRRQPARLEVVDEAAAGAWCTRHLPDAVRVAVEAVGAAAVELAAWQAAHAGRARLRRHLLREPLARHLAETGELPAGAVLRAASDVFYLK